MQGLDRELGRLGMKGSNAARTCVDIARNKRAFDGELNGYTLRERGMHAKLRLSKTTRDDGERERELLGEIARLYRAGDITREQAEQLAARV